MTSESIAAVLHAYGLAGAFVSPLGGGAINDVYRVDHDRGAYVLKRYTGEPMSVERLELVASAEKLARDHGVPVPEKLTTGDGAPFVLHDGVYHVLARFVSGRTLLAGEASETAARSMGVMLARLHDSLSELWPGPVWVLPEQTWIEEHLRTLLSIGSLRRVSEPVDEMACRLLEHKLDVLAKLSGPPAFEPGWTHRDYTVRNVLFDEHDAVAAVIDFDHVSYTSCGYELMRSLDHSFPGWSDEGLAFFEAYAGATEMTSEDARRYAALFCYVSTFSTWPMRARYLSDEPYQERWDQFIALADRPWDADPVALAERLASLVEAGIG